jgi:hypothetical protein
MLFCTAHAIIVLSFHKNKKMPDASKSSDSDNEAQLLAEDDDEDDDDETSVSNVNLRQSLKIIRDPSKNAFDMLPSGETIGTFANRHAIDRYSRKVENKRERAREIRLKKRKLTKTIRKKKERNDHIDRQNPQSKIVHGVRTH